jgi:hypothetical protein
MSFLIVLGGFLKNKMGLLFMIKIKHFFSTLLVAILVLGIGAQVEAQFPHKMLPDLTYKANQKRPGGVLPPNSNAFGKSYGEWAAEFWKWVYSIPVSNHPLFDKGDCSVGQEGKVWFLGGTYLIAPQGNGGDDVPIFIGKAERECFIPNGKAIFFPIINVEANTIDEDPVPTEDELRASANDFADLMTDLTVTIDGKPVRNLKRYRAESPLYTIGPLEADNVAGADEGTVADAVTDGYWILLAPLSSGEHEIKFSGTADASPDFIFKLDITYKVTVY